jgi:spore maturation protein CgeB
MIIGNRGGTNVGESLRRAGIGLGWNVTFCESKEANSEHLWIQRLTWHFAGHRPARLSKFAGLVRRIAEGARPEFLISTGFSPLTVRTLSCLKRLGIRCLHYSTDDPWNPSQYAPWFLRTLPFYDRVFSTRRANLEDFRRLGCPQVSYMPFAYDPELFYPEEPLKEEIKYDILFVGGADDDRAPILNEILQSGLRVALYGDHWGRYKFLRQWHLGRANQAMLRVLTFSIPINLCLCRRANRDGHVMRSFEIPAAGGFMIAEDTREHREIFGEEGGCVLYFADPREAIAKANWALQHPRARCRMAAAAHSRIIEGANTYADRLQQMLSMNVQ